MRLAAAVLVLTVIAYWVRLLVTAHYSSTHNVSSSSGFSAFSDLLTGSAVVVGFFASGISFWRHPAGALILRIVVGVFSVIGVFLLARGLADLLGDPQGFRRSSLRPIPTTSGLILLCTYFTASFAASLPLVPVRHLFRLGLVLHYGVFPIALALIFLFGMPSDYYAVFNTFCAYLVAGLAFAFLNFRMYELRQAFSSDG